MAAIFSKMDLFDRCGNLAVSRPVAAMFVDLTIAAAVVTIVGFVFHLVQKTLTAVIALERDLNRLSSNLQKLAIRLSNVERYLERKADYISSALDTGITEDRF
jgi:predicted PurR-regulated permease PerM